MEKETQEGHIRKRKIMNAIFIKLYQLLSASKLAPYLFTEQIKQDFLLLYPGQWREERRKHNLEKVKIAVYFILAGAILAGMLFLSSMTSATLTGDVLKREGYDGNAQPVVLQIQNGKIKEKIEYSIANQKYTKEQIESLYQKIQPLLIQEMLGENTGIEHIDRKLNFVTQMAKFPFQISWACRDYSLIDSDGTLHAEKITREAVATMVTATLRYEDFEAEYEIPMLLYPPQRTPQQALKERAVEEVEAADNNAKYEKQLTLPDQIDGQKVYWSQEKDQNAVLLFLLCAIAGVASFFIKDRELHQKAQKREKQLNEDYPNLVSKLSVYIGAGMTTRAAWEKIIADREKRGNSDKRYLYQEMKITGNEMLSGISESLAYDRFGRRCRLPVYLKFAALIIQNLKKGSTGLKTTLQSEAHLAFEERKNNARKKGEEASAKLILPMIMQLCVVMLMIMIPAFLSF